MSQINKPTDYFNTKLYTGTGAEQSISSLDFSPDLTWIKNRDTIDWHRLLDSVRGATKELYSNSANTEDTQAQSLKSFDSNGFTLGTLAEVNTSGENYASWNWRGSDSSAVSNTDGSITSTVSASTVSGFSIVSYTGDGSTSGTVGHGLGVAPSMVLIKNRDNANAWAVYHKSIGATNYLELNTTSASTDLDIFNDTEPTSSVFSFGNYADVGGGTGGNTKKIIAYCFAEKKGFSKFGSFTGNGSTDGTFVYTGFSPSFILWKVYSNTGYYWHLMDNKRNTTNVAGKNLFPNLPDVEFDYSNAIDFLSNGFKFRTGSSGINSSNIGHIYMAFASEPLVGSNNVPATAR
jgi:hypothetical protein